MGDRGHNFAPADCGELGKNKVNDGPPHIGKRVAVEKKKRCPPVTSAEKLYGVVESGDGALPLAPFCFKRSRAL